MPARTTLPPVNSGGGVAVPGPGTASLWGITGVIWVDEGPVFGTEDGTIQHPYHTIGDAILAAVALAPTDAAPLVVYFLPGRYTNWPNAIPSVNYCRMQGTHRDSTRLVSLQGTRLFQVTHPHFDFWDLTIEQEVELVAAQPVITFDTNDAHSNEMVRCSVEVATATALGRIYVGGVAASTVTFKDCRLIASTSQVPILEQTAASTSVIDSCEVQGVIDINNGYHILKWSRLSGWIDWASAAALLVEHNSIQGPVGSWAINLTVQPSQCIITDNRIAAGAGGGYDINATLAVTGLIIENNVMSLGIDGDISHLKPERNVGSAGMKDFYPSILAAQASCTFNNIVVHMWKDEVVATSVLVVNVAVVIDGHGHTISRVGQQVAIVNATDNLTFRNVTLVGAVAVAGAAGSNCFLTLIRCNVIGRVSAGNTGGAATIRIRDCKLVGDATYPVPIYVNDVISLVYVDRTYSKGSGAISGGLRFQVANNNVRVRHSRIFAGTAANPPFTRAAAIVVNWYGHHNVFGADPDAGGWSTNLIAAGQRYSTYDALGDYGY